jgi:uncharacterized membrane protein YcaP (DUF421 family)
LIGLDAKDLEWYQMLIRTIIVFIVALVFIRLSGMRTFGTQSAFDVVVSITLGGMLSKCIMGHYPFFTSLAASGCLVLLHRLVSFFASRNKYICKLIEGRSVLLFRDGTKETTMLKRYNITDKEILAAVHEQNMEDFKNVQSIWLEPDGKISVTKKSKE